MKRKKHKIKQIKEPEFIFLNDETTETETEGFFSDGFGECDDVLRCSHDWSDVTGYYVCRKCGEMF